MPWVELEKRVNNGPPHNWWVEESTGSYLRGHNRLSFCIQPFVPPLPLGELTGGDFFIPHHPLPLLPPAGGGWVGGTARTVWPARVLSALVFPPPRPPATAWAEGDQLNGRPSPRWGEGKAVQAVQVFLHQAPIINRCSTIGPSARAGMKV